MSELENDDDILTDSQTELAMFILMLFVTPAICIVGIVGNVCSILVLAKQGLKKCSNILLLGLAISDITYLIGYNNPPKIVYVVFGKQSFLYPPYSSTILFVLSEIFLMIDYSSGLASLTLPMLITIERLVTVFFPLKVSRIITPQRTVAAVSCVFIFWYSNFIYPLFWFELSNEYNASQNKTVYVIVRSALFQKDKHAIRPFEEAWAYFSVKIPATFTFIGCVIIGIKVKMVGMKRKLMTGKEIKGSMNRTTKTLLAVCGVYTVTCAVTSLTVFIPEYVSFSISEDRTTNLRLVTYQLMSTLVCVNSSCNFVIYIVCNKNFRDAYKALFIKTIRIDLPMKKR
ncbi:unnamed protein product [Candidula unifasciata]|uniref:G-protein coupled receptors family 1 profile domain-containing protein n=1 Tax=Candidula unifasciata TaxID=100452 RepID=A0A8S3ZGW8_9EUPU|nr:unnamed protein product [Candidula unifasciata]